jgi:hypothetical protein
MSQSNSAVNSLVNVRYYTPNDIYYYTIDNRPLTDLDLNITTLANIIDSMAEGSQFPYMEDTSSTVNTISCSTPVFAQGATLNSGQVVDVKVANTNTGPATLNVNNTGNFPILSATGALQGGELVAGKQYLFSWSSSASSWLLLASTGGALPVGRAQGSEQAIPLGQMQDGSTNISVNTAAASSFSASALTISGPANLEGSTTLNGPTTLNGATTVEGTIAVPVATAANQAPQFSQVGSYNGVIASFATGTLPSTCWGQAVQVQNNATVTLPTSTPAAGSKTVLYGQGPFTLVSNNNQFIYSPPLGLTSTNGPTTVDVSDGGWIEITSRGDFEYDVTGGSILGSSGSGSNNTPFEVVSAGVNGTLTSNSIIGSYVNVNTNGGAGVAVTLPANCSGSYAVASSPAASAQTLYIVKMAANTSTLTTVGTITFAAGSAVGTFATASNGSAQVFNYGDTLYVQTPSSVDPDLANVAISIYLTLSEPQGQFFVVAGGAASVPVSNAYIASYVNAEQLNGKAVNATLPANCAGSFAVATTAAASG